MRYHWGHMPGHLYMHQRQGSTAFRGAGSIGQERPRGDDETSDSNEPANGEDGITYDECAQMGSESDNSDRDYDPEAESGDESSSSEGGSGQESQDDDEDDEWEVEPMYED